MITVIQVGDIVRLVNGSAPLRVEDIAHNGTITARYLSDVHESYSPITRKARHWTLHEDHNSYPQEDTMTAALYETKDGHFGTELTRNSQGKIVLELKGTGDVAVYAPEDLTEVRPYTVNLEGTHYEVKEGLLEKGDILVRGGSMYCVREIDTKCRKAQGPLPSGFRRVLTAPLETEEEEVVEG